MPGQTRGTFWVRGKGVGRGRGTYKISSMIMPMRKSASGTTARQTTADRIVTVPRLPGSGRVDDRNWNQVYEHGRPGARVRTTLREKDEREEEDAEKMK